MSPGLQASCNEAPLGRVQVTKHIIGQSVFQLAVMYSLVFHGDQLFGVPSASAIHGPSQHYTLVFNAFVLMQLFNQVTCCNVLCEGSSGSAAPAYTCSACLIFAQPASCPLCSFCPHLIVQSFISGRQACTEHAGL